MTSILVVCTGNICRSPMAEAFLRHRLEERGIVDITVASCGIAGWKGSAATQEAVAAMRERGIDITRHLAQPLTGHLIEDAGLILAMAAEHRDEVARLAPGAAARAFTLKELVSLIEQLEPSADRDPAEELLRRRVAEADALRRSGSALPLPDEDVADPLGLSLEAFRATAWEIEALSDRLANGLFARPEDEAGVGAETPGDHAGAGLGDDDLWHEEAAR